MKVHYNSSIFLFFLLFYSLLFTIPLAAQTNCVTECPSIELISLQKIGGFPQANNFVTCAESDTLSLLFFNEGTVPLQNVLVQLDIGTGLQYAGTVEGLYPEDQIGEWDISNIEHPIFIIEELDTSATFIALFVLESNCAINLDAGPVSVHASTSYSVDNCNGAILNCTQTHENVEEFSSEFREPVLNIIFTFPSTALMNNLNTPACQSIYVSQDGIRAYVEEFEFTALGISNDPNLEIASLSANGLALPYNYDPASQSLSATVTSDYFPTNFFTDGDDKMDEGEWTLVEICYSASDCLDSSGSFPVTYQAHYGCHDVICGDVTEGEGTVSLEPDFGANPIINVGLEQNMQICGDDAIIAIDLQSANNDPSEGSFHDLIVGFQLCETESILINDVQINNVSLPSNAYYYDNADFYINFNSITSDLDGNGGIADTDGDGRYDDLPGGEVLELKIFANINCSETDDCRTISCAFSQANIQGTRHCGQAFNELPNIDPPIQLLYGPTDIQTNESPITNNIDGYNFFNISDTNPRSAIVQFCYEFDNENIIPCDDTNTYFELEISGASHSVLDIEYVPNTASWANSGVNSNDVSWTKDYENYTALLQINAGNTQNNTLQCYQFTLRMDSCICAAPTFLNFEANVYEACTSGDCNCRYSRACKSMLAQTQHACTPCSGGCVMQAHATDLRRTTFGYTDHTLSTPITENTVAPADLNRYIPCDTMQFEYYYEVLDAEKIKENNTQFVFRMQFQPASGVLSDFERVELAPKMDGLQLNQFAYQKGGAGPRIPIDFNADSGCSDGTGAIMHGDESSYPGINSSPNSNFSYDPYDNTRVDLSIINWSDAFGDSNFALFGECFDYVVNEIDIENGDRIWFTWKIPLQKNPRLQFLEVTPTHNMAIELEGFLNQWDPNSKKYTTVGTLCEDKVFFETYCPGELTATSEITLDDCDASIQHTFQVSNPPPSDWYQNEYRPIFFLDSIYSPMPSPLVYQGNAIVNSDLETNTSIEIDAMINQTCTNYQGADYCQSSDGQIAYNVFYREDALRLGIGLNHTDVLTLSYDAKQSCPSVIQNISDYDLQYNAGFGCRFYHSGYTCSSSSPYDVCTASGINYAEILGDPNSIRDTAYTLTFNNTSTVYPDLSSSLDRLLIVDEANVNELNEYEICAGDGNNALNNMVLSISIPHSVSLQSVSDISNNNTLSFTEAGSDSQNNYYSVALADLAPNTCYTISVATELLFCPINLDFGAEICLTTSAGCFDPALSALLLQDGQNACTQTTACYEYSKLEADLQAEWSVENTGEQGLCDTLDFAIRIKNVKVSTLVNLDLQWWLPNGLEYVPNSWQVQYPGGPMHTGALTPIPDPTPDPQANNAYGIAYYYPDDNLFSDHIHSLGLPGILSELDSNRLSIHFRATTSCDAYVSGSPLYFRANASDVCESTISSGRIESQALVINNANPNDFAQFYSYAEPDALYCGSTTEVVIRSINISPSGYTEQTRVCVHLPNTEIDYVPNSFTFIGLDNFDSNLTESSNGGLTTICMDIPDGVGPGNMISYAFEAMLLGNAACGQPDISIEISSRIEDEECAALSSECDVFVLNSANALIPIQYLPSLPIDNFHPTETCNDDPLTAIYNYSFDVNNITAVAYNSFFTLQAIRDLNLNGILDDFEPVLDEVIHNVSINSGGTITVSGSVSVPRDQSCPIFFKIVEDSECSCDASIYYYDGVIPEEFDALGHQQVLCPNQVLAFPVCNDYQYAINPLNGATLVYENDSLYITMSEGFGIDDPVVLTVESNNGDCDYSFSTNLYQLQSDFAIGPYETTNLCSNECAYLDLNIPLQWLESAQITWSPATYLDDIHSPNPKICNPQMDMNYVVTLSFPNDGTTCETQANYNVSITTPGTLNMTLEGDLNCYNPFDPPTLIADEGYDQYTFYQVISGQAYPFATGNNNTLIVPFQTDGDFVVYAQHNSSTCPDISNTFTMNPIPPCYDYGDLPDTDNGEGPNNYQTSAANMGPNHIITPGLNLGTTVDYEIDGQASSDALGDGADEDGLDFSPITMIKPGMNLQIPLTINNTTGETAQFEAWIDWNGDGDFDDPNEMVADLSDGNGNFPTTLNVSVPYNVSLDQMLGIRIRLSHTDNMTPYGPADAGEIEDYLIMISCGNGACSPMIILQNQ